MGNAAGLARRRKDDVVQPVEFADDCGPDIVHRQTSRSTSLVTLDHSTPRDNTPRQQLEARVRGLEALCERQASQLQQVQQVLACVQRDRRRTVKVLQYNILASYLGLNTQPWFLYGADISSREREKIFAKYFERDANGVPKNQWPAYVEGVLTSEQIDEVVRQNEVFKWSNRKVRLLEEIRLLDADVISLVELDHPDYFQQCLGDEWSMVFHKRPRRASLDGCGVFWRRSKFNLLAQQGFDFADGNDDKGRVKRDRSCLMVLLEWKFGSASPLVVVSTHLAKDPDDRSQTAVRVRQVTQIMEGLTEFTTQHGAGDAPVVLCGDLNARHFGEIRGIARTVWQVTGSQLHKFLWCATDVPTGPTSITNARQCRIDAVQYLSNQMDLIEVVPVPRLPQGEVIPNLHHPSDHFPVCVRFRLKDSYQMHRELARAWLECVAGREKLHPLTRNELRSAFEFFDRDRSNHIHRHDLEEACLDLQCNFHDDIQRCLLDCFPDHQITYDNFIRAYEARLNHERIRSLGELECAFQYFSGGAQAIPLEKLEAAFREITPISFSDTEVKEMLARLDLPLGQEAVDVRSFCEVVCKASFPHRDRRKFSRVRSCSEPQTRTRTSTKEICVRLDRMHESFQLSPTSSIEVAPPFKMFGNDQPSAVGQPVLQDAEGGRCVSPNYQRRLLAPPTVE